MRTTASAPRKNAEEREEKRSCPAVSYGRVSDGSTIEENGDLMGSEDGDGPIFGESLSHLAWSDEVESW
jgi:hypothetical protein